MGVYIRDMKMPGSCDECDFLSGERIPFGDYVCGCMWEMPVDDEIVMEGRPDWCPLEEPKTGEWIDRGDHAECSNCGANSGTQYDGVEPVPRKTKFCPNCGVRMQPKLQGKHFDSIIIDECAMKGVDDENNRR